MKRSVAVCWVGLASVSLWAVECRQIMRPERPMRGDVLVRRIQEIDDAAWVGSPRADAAFYRFRREFTATAEPLRFDVSADERFVLCIDGEEIARGPHRGMPTRWYYQSYEVKLTPGRHVIEATVFRLGDAAPLAQLTWRGGSFILKAEGAYDKELTTGQAPWQVAVLGNTRMTGWGTSQAYGTGHQAEVKGTDVVHERPATNAYAAVHVVQPPVRPTKYATHGPGWQLFPTERPDQMRVERTPGAFKAAVSDDDFAGVWQTADAAAPQVGAFNALLREGRKVVIPPQTALRVLWDLDDYYCAYPELRTSGGAGAVVRWGWTESLRMRDKPNRRYWRAKGNRDAFDGKDGLNSSTDTFLCDGRADAVFSSPWWRCGRWCLMSVRTAAEPLTIEGVKIVETRYPLSIENAFACDDASIEPIRRICQRSMQMCMHEMLFDCPYYEQQMYPGDTRIQLLILSALTRDDRMTRFAMTIYDCDRRDDGMVPMNFPTRGTQESATYSMCWALMFRDYVYWHDNAAWLKTRLPGLRNTLSGLALYANAEGLLENLPGWCFMDWCPRRFNTGVAPCGGPGQGVSALNNLLYLLALQSAAETEAALGETEFAAAWRAKAQRLGQKILATFWDERRGLVADTVGKDVFSEHAQVMALLGGILAPEQRARAFKGLVSDADLTRCSSYFAHYLFDAYTAGGRTDLIMKRLDEWKNFLAHGARTAFETQQIESRSDCHAWSACPEYHLQASIAGVRPSAPFFAKVRIAPQPAALKKISSRTPHPKGFVETDLLFAGDSVKGSVLLPEGVSGTFEWKGRSLPLKPGRQTVDL
ncbi:MAG: hypothetical protein ACI4Q3_10745 [Kiritimatiellia bacterium]